MKRLLIISLLLITSCYKNQIDKLELNPGNFHDEYFYVSNVSYDMTCSVQKDSAEINFLKKTYIKRGIYRYTISGTTYYVEKDTTIALQENYKYNAMGFKVMLYEKNKIKRDSYDFKFSPNMRMRWSAFDEILENSLQ